MTDLLQTTGRCSDPCISRQTRLLDFDKHGVGRESVVGVQFTSWGNPQMVVAALDVGQPVLARYRHSRRFSVEHGQDSRMLNGTFPGRCGQNEILNNQSKLCFCLTLVLCILPRACCFFVGRCSTTSFCTDTCKLTTLWDPSLFFY